MNMKEALTKALSFEQKGHEIYESISNKTKNDIVAKTFRYLADQEIIHLEEIKEYIEKLEGGDKIALKGDQIEDVKKLFKMNVSEFKEKTEASSDDLKAHETALSLEKSAYDFYKEQLGTATSDDAKKFFEWLMEQESAHYQLIQNTYDFIKSPEDFFADEEKWIVEG